MTSTFFIAITTSCLKESVCLEVFGDTMFVKMSSNSCPLNLVLVRSQQAEIIIVKRFIKGRKNVTIRMRVEPTSYDHCRRKNDVFALSATLPTGFKFCIVKILCMYFYMLCYEQKKKKKKLN